MMTPGTYSDYLKTVKDAINEITVFRMVANEGSLKDVVQKLSKDDIALIAVIPSADQKGKDIDSINEDNSSFLFLLQRARKVNDDNDAYILQMDNLANIMKNVKDKITTDSVNTNSGCPFCRMLDFTSLHTDPEYNYLGCNGYSLNLLFNTIGF